MCPGSDPNPRNQRKKLLNLDEPANSIREHGAGPLGQ